MILVATLLLAGQVHVDLQPNARVRGTELHVDSVAEVRGNDTDLVERVRRATLGYAPAPGYSRLLQGWRVERELEQKLPGVDIVIAAAAACRVEPDVQVLQAEELFAAALVELQRAWAGADVEIEPVGETRAIEIPIGRDGHRLRARFSATPAAGGDITVPVEIVVDGETWRTVWTSWRVVAWTDVPVLVRAVRAGETLAPSLFRTERMRVDGATVRGRLAPAAADGAVAMRDLQAGAPVLARDVRRVPHVHRGRTIQLLVQKGAIRASVSAVARQDGFLGDEIAVQPANAQREVRAVVVGRDLVRVDMAPTSVRPR